ncbi:hypothetical protein DWV22_00685 [Weissella confusa]|nr:hypothetical protein [Weissella confusa]MCT8396705.1 hypothetical protein [Weissella confusa]RGX49881.1 hypothetical protein DWV22_00685 [Weissella confusa]
MLMTACFFCPVGEFKTKIILKMPMASNRKRLSDLVFWHWKGRILQICDVVLLRKYCLGNNNGKNKR